MLRLVSTNGKSVPVALVHKSDDFISPQDLLNEICVSCFLFRRHYLSSISDVLPFDKHRAALIMDRMITKGMSDPKAYSLGNSLRLNWHRFNCLS